MTIYLLVLMFSDGTLALPTEPIAYSTLKMCSAAAYDINNDKPRKQQWAAICTPLAVRDDE